MTSTSGGVKEITPKNKRSTSGNNFNFHVPLVKTDTGTHSKISSQSNLRSKVSSQSNPRSKVSSQSTVRNADNEKRYSHFSYDDVQYQSEYPKRGSQSFAIHNMAEVRFARDSQQSIFEKGDYGWENLFRDPRREQPFEYSNTRGPPREQPFEYSTTLDIGRIFFHDSSDSSESLREPIDFSTKYARKSTLSEAWLNKSKVSHKSTPKIVTAESTPLSRVSLVPTKNIHEASERNTSNTAKQKADSSEHTVQLPTSPTLQEVRKQLREVEDRINASILSQAEQSVSSLSLYELQNYGSESQGEIRSDPSFFESKKYDYGSYSGQSLDSASSLYKLKKKYLHTDDQLHSLEYKATTPRKNNNTLSESSRSQTNTLPESNRKESSMLPESNRKESSTLPESNRKELSMLPESNRKELSMLPESKRKELSMLPESKRKELSMLPESNRKESSTLSESNRKELSTLSESNRKELSMLPESNRKELSTSPESNRKELSTSPESNRKELSMLPESNRKELSMLPQSYRSQTSDSYRHHSPRSKKDFTDENDTPKSPTSTLHSISILSSPSGSKKKLGHKNYSSSHSKEPSATNDDSPKTRTTFQTPHFMNPSDLESHSPMMQSPPSSPSTDSHHKEPSATNNDSPKTRTTFQTAHFMNPSDSESHSPVMQSPPSSATDQSHKKESIRMVPGQIAFEKVPSSATDQSHKKESIRKVPGQIAFEKVPSSATDQSHKKESIRKVPGQIAFEKVSHFNPERTSAAAPSQNNLFHMDTLSSEGELSSPSRNKRYQSPHMDQEYDDPSFMSSTENTPYESQQYLSQSYISDRDASSLKAATDESHNSPRYTSPHVDQKHDKPSAMISTENTPNESQRYLSQSSEREMSSIHNTNYLYASPPDRPYASVSDLNRLSSNRIMDDSHNSPHHRSYSSVSERNQPILNQIMNDLCIRPPQRPHSPDSERNLRSLINTTSDISEKMLYPQIPTQSIFTKKAMITADNRSYASPPLQMPARPIPRDDRSYPSDRSYSSPPSQIPARPIPRDDRSTPSTPLQMPARPIPHDDRSYSSPTINESGPISPHTSESDKKYSPRYRVDGTIDYDENLQFRRMPQSDIGTDIYKERGPMIRKKNDYTSIDKPHIHIDHDGVDPTENRPRPPHLTYNPTPVPPKTDEQLHSASLVQAKHDSEAKTAEIVREHAKFTQQAQQYIKSKWVAQAKAEMAAQKLAQEHALAFAQSQAQANTDSQHIVEARNKIIEQIDASAHQRQEDHVRAAVNEINGIVHAQGAALRGTVLVQASSPSETAPHVLPVVYARPVAAVPVAVPTAQELVKAASVLILKGHIRPIVPGQPLIQTSSPIQEVIHAPSPIQRVICAPSPIQGVIHSPRPIKGVTHSPPLIQRGLQTSPLIHGGFHTSPPNQGVIQKFPKAQLGGSTTPPVGGHPSVVPLMPQPSQVQVQPLVMSPGRMSPLPTNSKNFVKGYSAESAPAGPSNYLVPGQYTLPPGLVVPPGQFIPASGQYILPPGLIIPPGQFMALPNQSTPLDMHASHPTQNGTSTSQPQNGASKCPEHEQQPAQSRYEPLSSVPFMQRSTDLHPQISLSCQTLTLHNPQDAQSPSVSSPNRVRSKGMDYLQVTPHPPKSKLQIESDRRTVPSPPHRVKTHPGRDLMMHQGSITNDYDDSGDYIYGSRFSSKQDVLSRGNQSTSPVSIRRNDSHFTGPVLSHHQDHVYSTGNKSSHLRDPSSFPPYSSNLSSVSRHHDLSRELRSSDNHTSLGNHQKALQVKKRSTKGVLYQNSNQLQETDKNENDIYKENLRSNYENNVLQRLRAAEIFRPTKTRSILQQHIEKSISDHYDTPQKRFGINNSVHDRIEGVGIGHSMLATLNNKNHMNNKNNEEQPISIFHVQNANGGYSKGSQTGNFILNIEGTEVGINSNGLDDFVVEVHQ